MPEGFLSRWARLKRGQQDGSQPAPEPAAADREASRAAATASIGQAGAKGTEPQPVPAPAPAPGADAAPAGEARDPNLDLPPIESLTPDSDFTPFLRTGVAPATRTAALKKLFADPAFNVMDGLDVYIEDYGKTEPIPDGMLRSLAQSRSLGLFDGPKEADAPVGEAAAIDPGEGMEALASGESGAGQAIAGRAADPAVPPAPEDRRPAEGGGERGA